MKDDQGAAQNLLLRRKEFNFSIALDFYSEAFVSGLPCGGHKTHAETCGDVKWNARDHLHFRPDYSSLLRTKGKPKTHPTIVHLNGNHVPPLHELNGFLRHVVGPTSADARVKKVILDYPVLLLDSKDKRCSVKRFGEMLQE
jgi:hypothetical protein